MPSIKIPELNREVFETVVKSIYKDPLKASIREIIANAVDANKDNNATKSVVVSFNYDSTVVRDYGTGMSPQVIADIYGSMYQSTKRSENEDTITDRDGEFGIGSKSPYGVLYQYESENNRMATSIINNTTWPYYIDYYTVKTVHDGIAYMYIMYLSEDGIPSYDLIDSHESDEESGTEVSLPFTYNISSTNDILNDDTQELIDVIYPFYTMNRGPKSIDISGTNTLFIEQIKRVMDSSFSYKRIHFINFSVLRDMENITNREFSVKYKNIIYPFDEYSLTRYQNESMYRVFYDIDTDVLSSPLAVNRSRDRIDMDSAEEEMISSDAIDMMEELFSKTRDFVSSLVEYTTITNLIKMNYLMKTIIESGISRSYSPKLKNSITEFVNKKLLPKDYEYKDEFQALIDLFKVDDPEEAYAIAEMSSGINRNIASLVLNGYGFCFIPEFEKIFQTIESESEGYIKSLAETGLLTEQVSKAERDSEADKVIYVSQNYTGFKRSIKGMLGASRTAFVFKDIRKSFKLPAGLMHYDNNIDVDKIFMIDLEKFDHVYKTLKKEGVKNVYKISDLQTRYAERIAEIKDSRKQKKHTGGVQKRVGGIYRFNEHTKTGYDCEVQCKTKKTVMSDTVQSLTEKVEQVYVIPMTDKKFKTRATSLDGQIVEISLWVTFFEYDIMKEFDGAINIIDPITDDVIKTYSISDSEITRMTKKDSMLLVCDDTKYDKIIDYVNNDNIYSFNDYIKNRIENISLEVNEPVTVSGINSNIGEIVENMNSKINSFDDDSHNKMLQNIGTKDAISSLLNNMVRYEFINMNRNVASTTNDQFERCMLIVSTIVPNIENADLANEIFKKVHNNVLVRALIRGINMSSINMDGAVDEVINHFIDVADLRKVLNSYLTK